MLPKRSMSWGGYFRLKTPAYRLFILREISSVFNAIYAVLLAVLVYQLHGSKAAYEETLSVIWSMPMLLLHLVAIAFAVLHTITWFNATGTAIVVRRGEERLPDWALAVPTYAAWMIASGAVIWLLSRGLHG